MRRIVLLPLAALFLAGCVTTFDTTGIGIPVTLASPAGQPPAGEPFKVNSHSVFGLWGILTFRDPSLEKALAGQLVGGKAIANVKVKARSRWNDVLITVLTAGIVIPRTVTFEGVIVK
ncbi:MAG TPA: hypothetical protein VFO06_00605 [Gemmatimonadales bacterium]|nr:hypothetical protein [Gemmatimonadales bacterium]